MDRKETWEYITSDPNRFEQFCHYAFPACELEGKAKKNYKKASEQAPFDGETHGTYRGCTGRIVFEYKSSESLNKIKKDLIGNSKKQGKLRNTSRTRKSPKLYVLVSEKNPTHQFGTSIQEFIRKHRLPFKFCSLGLDQMTRERWLETRPDLFLKFRSPSATRTLDNFIDSLKAQGAPVEFTQYRHLNELFVPPREYKKIFKVLQQKRIVFVIGPPHVGKTFTAAHILWHFYCDGKEARWVFPKTLGEEPSPDQKIAQRAKEPKESLVRLVESNIGNENVTYIEDIFGRTSQEEARWKKMDPAHLLREVVDYVRDLPEALVILTSREKIFEQALKAAPELENIVIRLRSRVSIKTSSYTVADKKELLCRYARLYSCGWRDPYSEKIPQEAIQAAQSLDTPQAIWLFCQQSRHTTSANKVAPFFLKAKIELTKAFSNEIRELDDVSIAFLLVGAYCSPDPHLYAEAFPLLAGHDPINTWNLALKNLQDRVSINELFNFLEFVHPSYQEALDLTLRIKKIGELFNRMCSRLASSKVIMYRLEAAKALALNFKDLDRKSREVLKILIKDPSSGVRSESALWLARNFNGLDLEGKRHLIKMAQDSQASVRKSVAIGLASHFEFLSEDGRKLFQKLNKDIEAEVRGASAEELGWGFEFIGREGREFLKIMAKDSHRDVRKYAALGLTYVFNKLDQEGRSLLRDFAKDSEEVVRERVAWGFATNYENIDLEDQELLQELAKDPQVGVRGEIARGLALHFMALDRKGKKLLQELANDSNARVRSNAAFGLSIGFKDLDREGRRLLHKLVKDSQAEVLKECADGLTRNFRDLDAEGRKLLRKLVTNSEDSVRGMVARGLAYDYMDLDHGGRNLLKLLIDDPKPRVRGGVALGLACKFKYLNSAGRKLFTDLAKDISLRVRVLSAAGLARNFKDLDHEGRQLLKMLVHDSKFQIRQAVAYELIRIKGDLDSDGYSIFSDLARAEQ